LEENSFNGGEILSILDKTKKKAEETAKKTEEGLKNAGEKASEETKKGVNKVSGK
jgi:hypothetical protein